MAKERNSNGQTIAEWKRDVDKLCQEVCGLTFDCLVDFPIWDSWNAALTAEETLDVLAEYDDMFAGMLELYYDNEDY